MHFKSFFHGMGHRHIHDDGEGRHGGRHGRGLHHRRGGGGRLFDHGDLRLVILSLLAEKPRYGYEIIKELESRVGGEYSPSPGVIYPTLTLLEEVGHATISETHGGRKLYTLTDEGRDYVASTGPLIDSILARIHAGAAERRGPPASILRALENLSMAVRLKLKGQIVADDKIRAIADVIDETARRVEEM